MVHRFIPSYINEASLTFANEQKLLKLSRAFWQHVQKDNITLLTISRLFFGNAIILVSLISEKLSLSRKDRGLAKLGVPLYLQYIICWIVASCVEDLADSKLPVEVEEWIVCVVKTINLAIIARLLWWRWDRDYFYNSWWMLLRQDISKR